MHYPRPETTAGRVFGLMYAAVVIGVSVAITRREDELR
jgi:hypothetical protein